ncbi:DMT family transporter [Frankia sp. QA3]|uniref:DMT family transporter n=1 Tax=Frankia sp. QA3 TaxID=710111 RepID=UPI000269C2E8|nr:DMT family transporter [Frankia sp. QA3]EIV91162.1 DMT(drug/metabolite transporter) superfamily permease [Frankia sp. QA3]
MSACAALAIAPAFGLVASLLLPNFRRQTSLAGVSRRGWLLFVAMALFWGVPYLFIKVAVREVDPVVVTFCRLAVAVVVLLPMALGKKSLVGFRGCWLRVAVLGLVQIGVPFVCISIGERYVASALTSLLIAAEPVFVALLAPHLAGERISRTRAAGLGLGLGGVAALVGVDVVGDMASLVGAALILFAAGCYALGALLVRRRPFADLPRLGVVTVECVAAAAVLLPVVAFRVPGTLPGWKAQTSIVVLGVVCTALAWFTCLALIDEVGASRGTVFTYVNPAVAVVLGVVFLNESLTGMTAVGFLLILAGSWIATGGRLPGLPGGRGARRDGPGSAVAGRPPRTRPRFSPSVRR